MARMIHIVQVRLVSETNLFLSSQALKEEVSAKGAFGWWGGGKRKRVCFIKTHQLLYPPAHTHIHSYTIHYNVDVDGVVVGVYSRVAEADAMWDSTVSADALVVDVRVAAIGVVVGACVLGVLVGVMVIVVVAREFVMCVVVGVYLQAAGVDWTSDPMAIPVIGTSKLLNCPRTR